MLRFRSKSDIRPGQNSRNPFSARLKNGVRPRSLRGLFVRGEWTISREGKRHERHHAMQQREPDRHASRALTLGQSSFDSVQVLVNPRFSSIAFFYRHLSLSLSHGESAFSPLNQIALPLFMLVAARLFDCPFQLPPPLLCVRGYPDGSSGRPFLLPPSMHPTGQLLNVGQGPTATRWLPVTCERARACPPSRVLASYRSEKKPRALRV